MHVSSSSYGIHVSSSSYDMHVSSSAYDHTATSTRPSRSASRSAAASESKPTRLKSPSPTSKPKTYTPQVTVSREAFKDRAPVHLGAYVCVPLTRTHPGAQTHFSTPKFKELGRFIQGYE